MKMTAQEYARRVRRIGPHSPLGLDCLWAFGVGGGICLLGWPWAAVPTAVLRQTPIFRHFGRGSRPCRHPDQLQPDRVLSGAYHADGMLGIRSTSLATYNSAPYDTIFRVPAQAFF